MEIFDEEFELEIMRCSLLKSGFDERAIRQLMKLNIETVKYYTKLLQELESIDGGGNLERVPDGVLRIPLTNLRKFLIEFPQLEIAGNATKENLRLILASQYGIDSEVLKRESVEKTLLRFIKVYKQLLSNVARARGSKKSTLLADISRRSRVVNRLDRVTGDGICVVTDILMAARKKLNSNNLILWFSLSWSISSSMLPMKSTITWNE